MGKRILRYSFGFRHCYNVQNLPGTATGLSGIPSPHGVLLFYIFTGSGVVPYSNLTRWKAILCILNHYHLSFRAKWAAYIGILGVGGRIMPRSHKG